MIKVLVAEDEKLIRKGIASMVQRWVADVEQVLEARDGSEAWEILCRQPVDLLITDIRMPEMDGIALVEKTRSLPVKPLVVVVSGYDDFSYAVRMLRHGVQDYLLKPIEPQKFKESMERVSCLISQQKNQQRSQRERYFMTLSYLMEQPEDEGAKRSVALREVADQFFSGPYQAVCTRDLHLADTGDALMLRGADGLSVFLAESGAIVPDGGIVGVSLPHVGAKTLHQAYQESLFAWKQSYFTQSPCIYEGITDGAALPKSEHLLDLIRLSRWQETVKLLEQAACQVEQGKLHPDALSDLCQTVMENLAQTYQELYEAEESPLRFKKVWVYSSWRAYIQELSQWMELFCQRLDQKFADYESKQKIRDAVRYIHQNFRAPINMAMVSNHVSMNYSLFSVLFKQYTGVNFVNYLQNIRLEEAKRLLLESNLRVNEISSKAGFSGEKHFAKVFKAATGVSPSDWKKLNLLKQEGDEKE